MALIEFRSNEVQELDDLPGFRELLPIAGSGAVVNRVTAMRLGAVYACVRAICDDIAGLPLNVKRKKKDGKTETVKDHPAQDKLKLDPNPEMRSFAYKKVRMAHVLLNGNSCAFIERSLLNPVKHLWPLDPDAVDMVRLDSRDGSRGKIKYRVQDGYNTRTYDPEDILHLKGFSWNGLMGDSVITNFAREQIGVGLEMDQFEAAFFKNGLNPGGVFEHPTTFGAKTKDGFLKAVKKRFSGSKNRGLPMVLEEGLKFVPYEVKMVDQQFLDLLKLNKVDICGMFGVPQSRIGISDSNTNYNNSEQEKIRYYEAGLLPWAIPDEQEMTLRLLTAAERKNGLYIKYNFDAFLRGDSKTRAQVNQIYHRMGVPLNDLLAQDDRNPVPGGDKGLVQINMAPVDAIGDIQKAKFSGGNADAGQGDAAGKSGRSVENGRTAAVMLQGLKRGQKLTDDEKAVHGIVKLEVEFSDRLHAAADRVVQKECDRVAAQIDVFFGVRSEDDFILWLDGFYSRFSNEIKSDFGPVLSQYADLIRKESGRIVGGDPALTSDMKKFVGEYLDTYTKRHVGSSLRQLKGLVSATDPEELYDVLTKRISDWREKRPAKIANDEAIRAANAVAREKWRQLGVTKLKWVTQGSKACPFCKQLANKIVGVREAFLDKGDVLTGQDADGNHLRITGSKAHPPIHRGCVCAIRPMTETRSVFNPAGAADFVGQRDKLPDHLRPFITPLTAEQYDQKNIDVFLSDSGFSGYGLTPEKELVSVFSLPGSAQGKLAVDHAVKNGAKTLDCFDTILVNFYNQFGFEETERLHWDDQYAPGGWDYTKYGRPDIVFMKRQDKKSDDPMGYKQHPDKIKDKSGQKGNKGTKAFQDLADDFVETTFGKDELDKLKKK